MIKKGLKTLMKENQAHQSKLSDRNGLKIDDGADAVLKSFKIPAKGVFEYSKLFPKEEVEAEKFEMPPKYGMKIMPISKRFYLMSDVVNLEKQEHQMQLKRQ